MNAPEMSQGTATPTIASPLSAAVQTVECLHHTVSAAQSFHMGIKNLIKWGVLGALCVVATCCMTQEKKRQERKSVMQSQQSEVSVKQSALKNIEMLQATDQNIHKAPIWVRFCLSVWDNVKRSVILPACPLWVPGLDWVLGEPPHAEHKKNRQYLQLHDSDSCHNVDFLNMRTKQCDTGMMDTFVTNPVCLSHFRSMYSPFLLSPFWHLLWSQSWLHH